MPKVWRRLQRIGKKATKYKFTTCGHAVSINCVSKWQPNQVCIIWAHRNRKYQSRYSKWEPGLTNVYEGTVEWDRSVDQLEFDVTLYRAINETDYEEKEWTLMIESDNADGKKRLLATGKFNLEQYASMEPFHQTEVQNFALKPASSKIKSVTVSFQIGCQFIKEGKATDEDMISIASYMSTASTATNTCSNILSEQKYDGQVLSSENNSKKNIHLRENNDILENEELDIDSYFDHNFSAKLDNIAYNFMDSTANNTLTEASNIHQVIPHPIIKKSHSSQIKSSFSGSNLAKMTSLKNMTPSHSKQHIKISENNTKNESKESNPFLESNELEEKDSHMITANPFEDEANDDSNPFLNDESSETTTVEVDNNFNIKLSSKNNQTGENDPNNKTSKDLLDWCKEIIQCSKLLSHKMLSDLEVNDFTGSWTNGIAFCVIIHHFRPDLINLNELSETDFKSNLKQAFNATDKESIVRVVDYADFLNRKNLDRLSIMTYLYQIREKYDPSNPCSYNMSPNSKTLTSLNQEAKVKNFSNFSATPNSIQNKKTTINVNKVNTLVNNQQIKNSFFNPFDSDDDDLVKENMIKQKYKGIIEIKSPEETKSNHQKKQTADKKKSSEKFSKFMTPKSKTLAPKKNTSSEELINSAMKLMERNKSFEENDELRKKVDKIITESKYTLRKPSEDLIKSTNPFEDEDENLVGTEYINQEIINLKQKQKELDEKGGLIEKQLRSIMKKTSAEEGIKVSEKDKKLEDKLLKEWFLLVNERNVLLHQQQELELLQNEKSLEKRYQILSDQLRNLMQIEDNLKTEEQKKTESVLFNELINLVNKRNELVLQLDEENKLLNEGECINEYIVNKSTFQPKESQCVVQ